jgi:putative ABC transport system substrate-binding protein
MKSSNSAFLGRVAAIVAVGGTVVALAAKAATSTIPVVFLIGDDPAKAGLVASFNHPAGNVTGLSQLAAALGAKRVELLHELKPEAATLGVLINPSNPNAESDTKEAQAAAHVVGKKIVDAASEHEFESVFAQLVRSGVGALMVSNDAFFTNQREQLVALAARNVMPAIYAFREYTVAGGLISYGPSFLDMYRQVGIYAGRVLKGEQPRDLPVMQPTRFELVINLKTARALGLDAPAKVLALADEVIE